jgi:glycosyltransferase involved in cell wall biosynthesis
VVAITTLPGVSDVDELATELRAHGVRRIHVLAWRDLDDPEAGGSEVHADHVMRRWASAGLQIVHRTSAAAAQPAETTRRGYRVVRRGSRYGVFPRTAAAEVLRRMGPRDALVEIWNGVPWMSPVWCRGPRVTWLHHVHGPMWNQVLPPPLAQAGRLVEARLAPPFYRRTHVVTLAESSREELTELGFPDTRVHVVPPGVEPVFRPGGERAAHPLVVATGRLAPVKRFGDLIDALARARADVADLRLVIVGEGPSRPELEARLDASGARGWVRLAGRVPLDELIDLYRQAWLTVSASLAEGWGMVLTEAAACGTPAVATDIVGHRGAVIDGATGVLVPTPADLAPAVAKLLQDPAERDRLAAGALVHARTLTWERTATGTLAVLLQATRERAARATS